MKPREVLERPFPLDLVRRRPGRNGEDITYVEGHAVVARLNEAFDGDWSFEVTEHEVLGDEVLVLGRLSAGCVVKMAFGSAAITRTRDDSKPVSLVDDLKAAATDALKKAATLLGVGLQLHAAAAEATPPPPPAAPAPRNGNGYLSQAQLRALHAIRRKLGWTDAQLGEFAAAAVGGADVEKLTKAAASTLIERLQAELPVAAP